MKKQIKCPRCKTVHEHELLNEYKEETNINKLASRHYKCVACNYQFNRWMASDEQIKNIFGDQYIHYKNNC